MMERLLAIMAHTNSGHKRMLAKMDSFQEELKAGHVETNAMLEAFLEKMEANSEEIKSIVEIRKSLMKMLQ
jgi:hypothetical protein